MEKNKIPFSLYDYVLHIVNIKTLRLRPLFINHSKPLNLNTYIHDRCSLRKIVDVDHFSCFSIDDLVSAPE